MKILVTGGSGVIGEGAIPELLSRGHSVRLLSRHATDDARQWIGVEPFAGDVSDAASLTGACDGCDAVLHIAGMATGTRNMIAEATRAQVKRFVFVFSLGADREAEQLVQQSSLDWTIVRPGHVYGPGDEVISLILKMVRTLPAVPVIADGEQEFQPLWHEDLAKVLAAAVEHVDLSGRIIEAAGPDVTTMNDLLRRFAEITGRSPSRIPMPAKLAELALRFTPVRMPAGDTRLRMLGETNVLHGENALDLFGIEGTPLERGLLLLADALPETSPERGVGAMEHKRFHAVIRGTRHSAASLMTMFRERVNEFMPIEFVAEPGAPSRVEKGATLTGALPLRGNFQVRVEVAEPKHVVFVTIEGHPLSGIVEFTSGESADGVTFAIDVYARASTVFDWVTSRTAGALAQNTNWRVVVQRIIDASAGTSEGVDEEKEKLSEDEARAVEKRIRSIVQAHKREATSRTRASKPI